MDTLNTPSTHDIYMTIACNRHGYALHYHGPRIVHQVAATYFQTENTLDRSWHALVSIFRSLTVKDKAVLAEVAERENRPIRFKIYTTEKKFAETIRTFDDNEDVEPLRDLIKGSLLERIAGYRKELDFDIDVEIITYDFVTFKRTYSYMLRTLSIPREDPRGHHKQPMFWGSADRRYLSKFIPSETATSPAPEETR